MQDIWARLKRCTRGAAAMEYGLIAALIIVALAAGTSTVANRTGGLFGATTNALT